jgi:hypothetical protein
LIFAQQKNGLRFVDKIAPLATEEEDAEFRNTILENGLISPADEVDAGGPVAADKPETAKMHNSLSRHRFQLTSACWIN